MKSKENSILTYISLFSGAGIGCYGFKIEGFQCIASNEINDRRLKIQKYNKKCRDASGYISGNLVEEETKNRIRIEYENWKLHRNVTDLDLIIATPPCQGMSVANHKKKNELKRNSLVIESINLIREFCPKFFLFENVRSFLNCICTDIDGKNKSIQESIEANLAGWYNIQYRVINFKDYGNPSSRTRAIVLGTRKDLHEVSPVDFMPNVQMPKTVREIIGDLPPLTVMGEIDPKDIYHHFRNYSKHMRNWIKDLNESESAFDNKELNRRPHRIIDGKIVLNSRKNNDKYTRSNWDKPGPCIHTRNDILSSQTTIHPSDDRVFSVRELMRLMSIPSSFKWTDIPEKSLNKLAYEEKRVFLKREELNIRQSIGEAVPTILFHQIAKQMKSRLLTKAYDDRVVKSVIEELSLASSRKLVDFVNLNPQNLSFFGLSKVVERCNSSKHQYSAYYTRQDICFAIVKSLPKSSKFSTLRILEPAVGTGNFLPLLIDKYKNVPSVEIDVVDIDKNMLEMLKSLVQYIDVPQNITINYYNRDFLLSEFNVESGGQKRKPYDIIVGNPPFGKVKNQNDLLSKYKNQSSNCKSNNIYAFFLERAIKLARHVSFIVPKSFLSAPEFDEIRNFVGQLSINKILDFGEKAFKGVRIETIGLSIDTNQVKPYNKVAIESYITKEIKYKFQDYICANEYPCWLLYRDAEFDQVADGLRFGVFESFRDRQITKKITKPQGKIRVLKSRNIGNNTIVDIPKYDAYIDCYNKLSIGKFVNRRDAVLVPNLTYYPRACFLPQNTIIDGSVAVLIPKEKSHNITKKDLEFYNSEKFTKFYRVARNLGTRSLNIDKNSVYFFGVHTISK